MDAPVSKTKNVILKVCLMFGSILVNASAHAGKPQVDSFDMQANGIDYRIFVAAPAEKRLPMVFPLSI